MLARSAMAGGAVLFAGLVLMGEARADCVRDGTVVTCATASPNGYDETVYSGRTDRTVNVSADVADGIEVNLLAGGNIAISQTAGTITNAYGDGVYLKTTDGKISGTIGNVETKNNGVELVAPEIELTVAGSVSGTGRYASGVLIYESGTATLTNSGGSAAAITGYTAGVSALYADTLTIHNTSGSKIVGTRGSGILASETSGDLRITNDASSISGTAEGAALWSTGGGVTVENGSGTIAGGTIGIDIWDVGGDVLVTNGAGAISGTKNEGIYIYDVTGGAEVRNGAGGTITGTGSYGVITYEVAGDTTIQNQGGTIRGKSSAIYADGAAVLIVNEGTTDAGGSHVGLVTGGNGGKSAVITLTSDAYSAQDETGGATLRNGAGGLIAGDAAPLSGPTLDLTLLAAAADDVAVKASGGRILIDNAGLLVGRLQLTAAGDSVENSGVWVVSGTNDFGTGADLLTNKAGGMIFAAAAPGLAETTRFDGLESFVTHGTFSLSDGGTGDTAIFSGAVAFKDGSTLVVDVDGAGQADLVSVSGSVTIDTGAGIRLVGVDAITFGTDYHVLTAAGGVSGNFGSVTGETPVSAFIGLTSRNTGTDIYVRLDQIRAFTAAAVTRNQRATAGALDTLPGDGPTQDLREALLLLGTDAQARGAFTLLSGEMHASAQSLFVTQSQLIRSALVDRLRAAEGAAGAASTLVTSYAAPSGPGATEAGRALAAATTRAPLPGPAVWATGFGSWLEMDGTGTAAGLSGSTGGVLMGADGSLEGGWRLGIAGGYSTSAFDAGALAGSGSSDNWHAGLYGGNRWGALGLRAGLAYTWQDVSTSRAVAFTGYADSLGAGYDAGLFQAFGELGYRVETRVAALEPFVNLTYVSLHTDGYDESGGAAALSGAASNMDTGFSTLGVRLETVLGVGRLATTATASLGWQHAFGDITPMATQSFIGAAPFTVEGTPIAEDAALVAAGLEIGIGAATSLHLAYSGQFGDGTTQNGVTAAMKLSF